MQPNKQIPDNVTKPFHSNGYAQVASGNRIGTTTSTTFNQRQVMESSRRIINGYKHSQLGITRGSLRVKPNNISVTDKINTPPQKSSLQQFNGNRAPINQRSQSYNPYS